MESIAKMIEVENTEQKIYSIKISVIADSCSGTVNITDIMLQCGEVCTTWNPHVSEINWVVNEDD